MGGHSKLRVDVRSFGCAQDFGAKPEITCLDKLSQY